MAKSGSCTFRRVETPTVGTTWYLDFILSWTELSRNETDMTTTIQWTLDMNKSSSTDNEVSGRFKAREITVTIENNVVTLEDIPNIIIYAEDGPLNLGTGTATLSHNADGGKDFSYGFSAYIPKLTISGIVSESFTAAANTIDSLDPYVKMATLISVTNFTDEDNPTITYSNASGDFMTGLDACISLTGGNDDIPYRPVSKTGTSYTFNLTGTERSKLWTLLDSGTIGTVRFYLRSNIDGVYHYTYKPATVTFVNYKPVLSPIVYDSNPDTIAVTGDKNKLIRYMSNAYFDTQAVARKGATIDNQIVRNGSLTFTGGTGTFNEVTSNTFNFNVTDNRGHTSTDFKVFSIENGYFIEYVKLTCSVSADQMTAEGNINVTVSGKYYEGTLGATDNTLTLRYSLNKENTEDVWYELGEVTPIVDSNNDYTYTFTISGLDYLSIYKLTVCAKDKVMHEESIATYTLASTPVFDWSKKDFNFNVPVTMMEGFTYPHRILWGDATNPYSQLGASDVITLKESISKQSTGIVLIFSLFRDDAVEDVSIHSFFVPRAQIQYLFSGAPHLFMMGINSNLSIFGSKYVYITDNTLRGFSGNTASGTAQSGITFDNSKFVLRYVLGV